MRTKERKGDIDTNDAEEYGWKVARGLNGDGDSDGDGIPNWYEWRYNTSKSNANNTGISLENLTSLDANADPDNDGLSNSKEYFCNEWGSNPYYKDIFVEVDWMPGHEFQKEAQIMVMDAFARHGIALHIDDGWMGGGEEVVHCPGDTITFERRNGENNDFGDYMDNYFTDDRDGIFHYCLMADHVLSDGDEVGGVANGPYGGHFTVADGEWNDIEAGSTFMHELGHTLGLHNGYETQGSGYFPGIDSKIYAFSDYPSVMNYNAPDDFYDYSTGDAGSNDHDDWEDILTLLGVYL